MASYNKLDNGIPIEILPYDHPEMWKAIDQLAIELLRLGLRGPINIQGRMTEKSLKVFEMNPRFTGITGLRSLMGFNEVEACIKDVLNIDKGRNQIKFNKLKFGIRQTADKAVLIDNNDRILEQYKQLHLNQNINKKHVLLLTGTTGFLGRHLANLLSENNAFEIWLLGTDKQKLISLFGSEHKRFDYDDFQNDRIHLGYVDTLVHLGFARPHKSNREIAQSVALSNQLFTKASLHHIPYIINVSSQSVYGNSSEEAWTENSTINPQTTYAQAKYAVETFLENINQINEHGKYTSLRLSSLVGSDPSGVDFISKMIESSLHNKEIHVYGGSQVLQRLDVKDAANAIYKLIENRQNIKHKSYNLGAKEEVCVLDIARKVKDIIQKQNNKNLVDINTLEASNVYPSIKMNSDLFYNEFDWKPQLHLSDSIQDMIQHLNENEL